MSYLCLNGLARWLLGDFYRTLLQAKCKQLFFRLVRQKCSLNISGVFKIVNKRKNDYKLLKLFKKKHWREKNSVSDANTNNFIQFSLPQVADLALALTFTWNI